MISESIRRIAVLNRGEAATRCFNAIRELRAEDGSGLIGIALYTDPERHALFVREADEAISLGAALRGPVGGKQRLAYLDHERVLAALRASRADAVWPGWGFLAEDPDFAERLAQAGIAFLGPSVETVRMLGDKLAAKRLAEAANVPGLPWSGDTVDRQSLRSAAEKLGLPLMLKAAAGGGGRGIRRVQSFDQLDAAFTSATGEALHAFGDDRVFLEACVDAGRHIEVQIAADRHGRVLALGLRDCSVQRNHQKIIEEAPPIGIPEATRRAMLEAAVRLAQKVGYVGVGTCEFLLNEDGRYFFLEVNPRLQVEHGVTEVLTGIDLVKWQIRIGRGEALPDHEPAERGHAIEARICAEDPASNFAPSPGTLELIELPAGPGIRVDSGLGTASSIPPEFDSMIAKVIAYGQTRDEARARLERALGDLRVVVRGGTTNKGFLLDVLAHDDFRKAAITTRWLEGSGIAGAPTPRIEAPLIAAVLSYQRERALVRADFYAAASRGRPRQVPPSTGREIDLVYAGCPYRFEAFAIGADSYRVYLDGRVAEVTLLEAGPHLREFQWNGARLLVLIGESEGELRLELEGRMHRVQRDVGGKVRAQTPGLVIEVAVRPGSEVKAGDRLGLLEAMKTETAFFAPVAGTVREVLVRAAERVSAGDVLLVIEPQEGRDGRSGGAGSLVIEEPADMLESLFDAASGDPHLGAASGRSGGQRAAVVRVLRAETRRLLMGYDVNPVRADRLVRVLEAPLDGLSVPFRTDLAPLARGLEIYADIESLFVREPSRSQGDAFGPSNDARMAMYLRRVTSEGAGIAPAFLDELRRALAHYEIETLAYNTVLARAALRLYATRTTLDLRNRVVVALLHMLLGLADKGEVFERCPELAGTLDRIALLRGTVPEAVADLAAHVRFIVFERPRRNESGPAPTEHLEWTLIAPPDPHGLAERARSLGLTFEEARRIELWRLENFELERVPTFEGVYTFYGRARDGSGDERLFCFAEVHDLGPATDAPDMTAFDQCFHEAIEGLRSLQALRDPDHRLHWNRLYLFVRPPLAVSHELFRGAAVRLAPETGHCGLERVIVRLAALESGAREPRTLEVMAGNPTGGQVEMLVRAPHDQPLAPATPYERRVAASRSRGLTYPYEVVRLFTSVPSDPIAAPGAPTGPGSFTEYDLVDGAALPVVRPPGQNTCGVVIGVITTPTVKYPEGMRRVLVLGDPTRGLGALAAPECDRIVAALELASRESLPVEWVAVSSGALIAMDSGTENLDATARVVRRLVQFTDAGGEVNLIVPGVNVGAQSYFDALATMGLQSRGILVMLAASSMVLTGRAALEFSGGVAAEDEVGIGGYERIMGPSGQAQYQARGLSDAYRILLEHYSCSYRAPGEAAPRRFATRDPIDRNAMQAPYVGDEGFARVGDIFSAEANPDRKRPFAMRPVMRALIDEDAGFLERWRDWMGAETAIVWDTHLGGYPVTLVGVESRPIARVGYVPNDGSESWTAGTLFPQSSKKVARALNAASGVRPALVLANLSGFDGSPESMRRGILELGAEIARAVVRFQGPLLFTVVSRYHGGAYVVFSRELNPSMRANALAGSFASVIGGSAAAAVVFPRDVRRRANEDPRVRELARLAAAATDVSTRVSRRSELERVRSQLLLEKRAEVAAEFDAIHSVERALRVGSLESILEPARLRPSLISLLGG